MKLYEILSKIKPLLNVFIPKSICSEENMLKAFEVKNIGISTTATADVIKKCALSGIDFLIVFDPIFYNPTDDIVPNEIGKKKRKLIEKNNLLIARASFFNYSAEFNEFSYWGLKGKWKKRTNQTVNSYILESAMTANDVAKLIKERLGIGHIKVIGSADKPCNRISSCFSTGDIITEELFINDIIVTSEINGQLAGDIVSDCVSFGMNKSLIVIPNTLKEMAGIIRLSDFITENIPCTNCKYIECGDLYTYT